MIKIFRERKGLTQTQLAEKIGVKFQSVQGWEKGRTRPSSKRFSEIAGALGITVQDLLEGNVNVSQEPGQYVTGNIGSVRANIAEFYTNVPFLSARAQAGIPGAIAEDCSMAWIEETYPVFMPLVSITQRHLIIEVTGDSMEPGIISGALVLAESVAKNDVKYESGAVYAVLYGNNRFVVKRVKTNDLTTNGALVLWSDNEKYGNITIHGEDIHCMWKITMKVAEAVR